jgi:excisionase family DNA binding protein
MQSYLSPKDLSLLIGVSESSLKRWVDDGRLRAERTAGGHRRIATAEAVRFIRETASPVADPTLLGLPELDRPAVDVAQDGEVERVILSAAREKNTARATGVLIAEFLRSRTVASVLDGPVTMLLNQAAHDSVAAETARTGVTWNAAADICRESARLISDLLAPPSADAPLAVVTAVGTEDAAVRAVMAAVVLREFNYRVTGAELAAVNGHGGRASFVCTVFDGGAPVPADQRRERPVGGVDPVWFGPGVAGLPPRTGVRIVHSLSELACVARAARRSARHDATMVRTKRSNLTM